MKNKCAILSIILLLFLLIMNCGKSESTKPETYTIPAGFVGEWQATAYLMTCCADPSITVDLIQAGLNVSITIKSNGSYTTTMSIPGDPTINDSGSMRVEGNQLYINPAGDDAFYVNYVLAGNTLSLMGQDTDFDFNDDGVDEPAWADIQLQKN